MLTLLDLKETSGVEFMLVFNEEPGVDRPFWLGGHLADKTSNPRENTNWMWIHAREETLEGFR